MGYPCIYQKFPKSFHDTITSPRLSHKNQMIWSLSHTISWDGMDPLYPTPSHTFPRRISDFYHDDNKKRKDSL